MKINRIILVLLLSFFYISTAYAEIITDDKGRKIEINLPVQSLVSLSPAQTEMVYALGCGDLLKAVTVDCNYPAPALMKEKAGSFTSPDIEKIMALKPEVVLATGELQDKAVEALEKLKVKVVVFDPCDITGIKNNIRIMGKLLGKEENAAKLTANIENTISGTKQNKRIKVYVELWGNPALSAGRGSFITDIISKAGGINVLADSNTLYPKVSPEEIIKRNPDVILLLYTPEAGYSGKSRFKLTKAGRLGNIFIINEKDLDVMLRPGPRILKAYGILTDIFGKIKTERGR